MYLRVVLLIHGVISQKNGIYTSIAVASPNLGYALCLQDGSYCDRLLFSK